MNQNWNSIRKSVSYRLKKGEDKRSLYLELRTNESDEKLRLLLASFPNYDKRLKYKKKHRVLIAFWIFMSLIEVMIGLVDVIDTGNLVHLVPLLVTVSISVGIFKFRAHAFLAGIIWIVLGFVIDLFDLINYGFTEFAEIVVYFVIVLFYIVGIFLMNDIRKNVFNYYHWFYPEKDHNDDYIYS